MLSFAALINSHPSTRGDYLVAMSDSEDDDDAISADSGALLEQMDEVELREYHEIQCIGGDGWSHGFSVVRKDDGQIMAVASPKHVVTALFTRENWVRMGVDISQNPALKSLDVSGCSLTDEDTFALFGLERTYHCPLESLDLADLQVGPSTLRLIMPFLQSLSSLRSLYLNDSNLNVEGARLFAEALEHLHVENFLLDGNDAIADEGIEILLSVQKSVHFTRLNLFDIQLGRRGFEAIARYLSRDDTNLRHVMVSCADEEYIKLMFDSVSDKSKLEHMYFTSGFRRDNDPIMRSLSSIQKLICNTKDFESLLQSNHRIESFGLHCKELTTAHLRYRDQALEVSNALYINARAKHGASVIKRQRCKLREFYFNKGNFDVHTFALMKVQLMPHVLELVTRMEKCVGRSEMILGSGTYYDVPSSNLSAIYQIVRNCHMPELFSFPRLPSRDATIQQLRLKVQELESSKASLKADVIQQKQRIDKLENELCLPSSKRTKT